MEAGIAVVTLFQPTWCLPGSFSPDYPN